MAELGWVSRASGVSLDDVFAICDLGDPAQMFVAMAAMVLRLTGSNAGVRTLPAREEDPRCRQPDISQAQRWLEWQPEVPLVQGLAQTIEWFRAQGAVGANRLPCGSQPVVDLAANT